MKILDAEAMSRAVKQVIDFCGIDVLADGNRFKAAIRDFMFGISLITERNLLIFSVRIGIGEEFLKAAGKSVIEQQRILVVTNSVLTDEYGLCQGHSDNILKAFASALEWKNVYFPKTEQHFAALREQKKITTPGKGKHVRHSQWVKDSVIAFGKYKWRVLYIKGNMALLLSDEITDIGIPYNREFGETSWAVCSLRDWLNTEFLNRFTKEEQRKIVTRCVRVEANPWYQTDAGIQKEDKVFILSISEVIRNFGNSGQPKASLIDDKFNTLRQASYKGNNTWWWLRSPGESKSKAAYVNADGVIILNGELVGDDGGTSCVGRRPGVRPAIWVRQ